MGTDPTSWPRAVQHVATLLGAEKALLFSPTPLAAAIPGVAIGLDPHILSEYAAHWHQFDIWTQRINVAGALNESKIILGEEFVPHSEFVASTVYNECLGRNGVGRLMTAAIVPHQRHTSVPATVCSFYSASDRGPFSTRSAELYRYFLPHFVQAMEAYWQWRWADAAGAIWRGALDQISSGVVVLDQTGAIKLVTPAAQELLAHSGIVTARNNQLVPLGPRNNATALTAAVAAARQHKSLTVRLVDDRGAPAIVLTASAAPDTCSDRSLGSFGDIVLLFRVVQSVDSAIVEMLRKAYVLTAREVDILERLRTGASPRQISDDAGINISTVRTHLKRLYEKTETGGQRELLSLLSRFHTAP